MKKQNIPSVLKAADNKIRNVGKQIPNIFVCTGLF